MILYTENHCLCFVNMKRRENREELHGIIIMREYSLFWDIPDIPMPILYDPNVPVLTFQCTIVGMYAKMVSLHNHVET